MSGTAFFLFLLIAKILNGGGIIPPISPAKLRFAGKKIHFSVVEMNSPTGILASLEIHAPQARLTSVRKENWL